MTDEADDKSGEDERSFSAASDVSDEEKDTMIKKHGKFHLTTMVTKLDFVNDNYQTS